MLKTGIYTVDALQADLDGEERRASITLLEEVRKLQQAEKMIERILLTFTDERGAYKRTYSNRFLEFDSRVLEILRDSHIPTSKITIHDVAVSDGRTAVDFFQSLAQEYKDLHYTASDYSSKVLVLERQRLRVTLSANGKIIEIVFPPFVFNAARPDRYWRAPLNRLIQLWVEYLYVKPLQKAYVDNKVAAKEILLFSAKALMLAENDARFKLTQHDLLQPFARQVDVIRAMNVLNPSYFTKGQLRQIVAHVYHGLKLNGLFVHGSNQNAGSLVNGAIYRKKSTGFDLVCSSGAGSYIADIMQEPIMSAK